MSHKVFISFKTEDAAYKKAIQEDLDLDMIDKSLDDAINSDDEDYIMRKIRDEYLSDSTVTIHLIGLRSGENLGWEEQKYIKRELRASLYNGENNTRNGILGVVLPNMYNHIYKEKSNCLTCNTKLQIVSITDEHVVKEFSRNYFIKNDKCHYSENDRYCILVKWDDFVNDAEKYIDKAFEKRSSSIADSVTVYPK